MTGVQVEIQLVAVVVAAACALPGVFLVLRRMALMSDAISHSISRAAIACRPGSRDTIASARPWPIVSGVPLWVGMLAN